MDINKNFGKLDENGNIEYAPLPLVFEGENVWTNDPEKHLAQGYYPVVRTDKPVEEGFFFTEYFEFEEGNIIQYWKRHDAKNFFSGYKLLDIITEGVSE